MDIGIWGIALPILSVVIVGIGIFVANSAKYFTIREYQAFETAMLRDIAAITKRIDDIQDTNRDLFSDVRDRIKVLEQTRPTTGELQAALRSGIVDKKDLINLRQDPANK